jgi:hypothetical protein
VLSPYASAPNAASDVSQPEGRQRSVDTVGGPASVANTLRAVHVAIAGAEAIERHTMKRSLARGHARGEHEAISAAVTAPAAGPNTRADAMLKMSEIEKTDRHPRNAQGSQIAGDGQRQKHQPFVADRTRGQISDGICTMPPPHTTTAAMKAVLALWGRKAEPSRSARFPADVDEVCFL